ncbi:uncharacterized protein M6B38_251555 [Iris pallida]|uniref:Uncharacterized protein n=1 Tax=Iris pallida TaxID=29817 RepID=A0AAX6IJD3_IRIPA|nr:uncharacterized protein M6B38_251555 [Iris pallida]
MESIEDDRKKKIELIQAAIHQLFEEKKKNKKGKEEGDEEEEDLLLSKLLSQLDSLEKDAHNTYLPICPAEEHEPSMSVSKAAEYGANEVGLNEVVRELKKVKRQNLITHCLLSVMIVVTAVWQFSEASLLIRIKQKFSHPIKSVGDMITDSLKGQGKKPKIEAPGLPPIGVPQLPSMDLSSLSLNGNEED